MIPDTLRERYAYVVAWYRQRFPEGEIPALPEDDPNAAVMAIDQMLAPLQDREPLRITVGEPVLFPDTTDTLDHPARAAGRAPFDKP
jgi:hypothetical protein